MISRHFSKTQNFLLVLQGKSCATEMKQFKNLIPCPLLLFISLMIGTTGFSQNEADFEITKSTLTNEAIFNLDLQSYSAPEINSLLDKIRTLRAENAQSEDTEFEVKLAFLEFYTIIHTSDKMYDRIISSNDLWNYRDELDSTLLNYALPKLEELYDDAGRFKEQLEVSLYRCQHPDNEFKCYGIGIIYHRLKLFNEAIHHYDITRKNLAAEENWFMYASFTNNIGQAYRDMGLMDSANIQFNLALKILNECHIDEIPTTREYLEHFKNCVRWNIETTLTNKNDSVKKQLAEKLIRSSLKTHEPLWTHSAYMELSYQNYQTGELEIARAYTDSAIRVDWERPLLRIEALELKAKILLNEGQKEASEMVFKKFHFLRDSLDQARLNRDAIVAAAFHESQTKEKKVQELKNQLIITNLKDQHQKAQVNTMRYLLIIGAILVVLLIFIARKLWKDQKKISDQNVQAKLMLDEKEVLLDEVHHRVKNNLQVVSSLLQFQSDKTDNQEFKELANEGLNRIQSIALVHEMLYEKNAVTQIDFNQYVNSLVKEIQASLKVDYTASTLISIQKIDLPIEKVISLGLILNELITNAYKHAFDNENATLKIYLTRNKKNLISLRVSDNGKGFPENFVPEESDSMGLQLIHLLSRQIDANVQFESINSLTCTISWNADD